MKQSVEKSSNSQHWQRPVIQAGSNPAAKVLAPNRSRKASQHGAPKVNSSVKPVNQPLREVPLQTVNAVPNNASKITANSKTQPTIASKSTNSTLRKPSKVQRPVNNTAINKLTAQTKLNLASQKFKIKRREPKLASLKGRSQPPGASSLSNSEPIPAPLTEMARELLFRKMERARALAQTKQQGRLIKTGRNRKYKTDQVTSDLARDILFRKMEMAKLDREKHDEPKEVEKEAPPPANTDAKQNAELSRMRLFRKMQDYRNSRALLEKEKAESEQKIAHSKMMAERKTKVAKQRNSKLNRSQAVINVNPAVVNMNPVRNEEMPRIPKTPTEAAAENKIQPPITIKMTQKPTPIRKIVGGNKLLKLKSAKA